MLRLLLLAQQRQWHLVLVYYPPYHCKYNPSERFWGVLENYWNGALLDSVAAVLGYAANMTSQRSASAGPPGRQGVQQGSQTAATTQKTSGTAAHPQRGAGEVGD
ncbi:MAG: ISAzo13-like element transposase-related protein [Gemmataceae bacterium]